MFSPQVLLDSFVAAMAKKNEHLLADRPRFCWFRRDTFVDFMWIKYRVPQVEAERFWWFFRHSNRVMKRKSKSTKEWVLKLHL